MRKTALLFLLFLPLVSCFNVFHHIHQKPDGSYEVSWKLTISSALAQMADEQKKNLPGESESSEDGKEEKTGESKKDILSELEKGVREMKKTYGKHLTNIRSKEVKSEFDTGMLMTFVIPEPESVPKNLSNSDRFPSVPLYDAKKNTLTFRFTPEKESEKKEEGPESDGGSLGPGPEQLAEMILGSARYQIYLTGEFDPRSAKVTGKNLDYPVQIIQIGNTHLIDFPFMAMANRAKDEPFELIVQLK